MPPEDGKLTGYARLLKEKGMYPIKPRKAWKARKHGTEGSRTATCFLVIPNSETDDGKNRPLSASGAVNSGAIKLLDSDGSVVEPGLGGTYRICCNLINAGDAGCFAGIAEFYIASGVEFDLLAVGARVKPPLFGCASFEIQPGTEITITCPNVWKLPAGGVIREPFKWDETAILVRAYDPIFDPATGLFNAATDRHVARKDYPIIETHRLNVIDNPRV